MVESQPAYKDVRLLVVMGSTGCGKTTIANALANRLGASCIEGDEHHTPENKLKMSEGTPLTDEDRWPWLLDLARVMQSAKGMQVVSCSALKKSYRRYIRDNANEPVLYIYLHGSRELLSTRLANRTDHFMNTALLDSQLATLEIPEEDEFGIQVSIDQSVEKIIDEIHSTLRN